MTAGYRNPQDPSSLPALIAHRGASHTAPENTLSAFRRAWQEGADGIEGDFRLTGDGRIVCIHDAATGRTCDRDLIVSKTALSELRKLDAGCRKGRQWRGEKIPLIEEVLSAVPEGKVIFIEIKGGAEMIDPLKKILASSGLAPEQMVIIAFATDVIKEAKRQLPDLKAYWLTEFKKNSETGTWYPSAASAVATLKCTGADGLGGKACDAIDDAFVGEIHRSGKELNLWTVNSRVKAKRFKDSGVDSLTTDCPGWLRE
ncbi:MAG: glycerophosphodiester phosphodiesterase [Syntrophales bacterium]|nr:glycerophosphodiester phosphodiesterase [Syntrophales bacterium]